MKSQDTNLAPTQVVNASKKIPRTLRGLQFLTELSLVLTQQINQSR